MSADDLTTKLLNLVNDSGFAFQLRVQHEIERTSGSHGWNVLVSEHQWTHHWTKETKDTGFVDLIIKNNTYVIVRVILECKRTKDNTNWVFLTPTLNAGDTSQTSFFWVGSSPNWHDHAGWIDIPFSPESPEAAFCTVHGQGDTKRPMLEHLADEILPATEAVGMEEFAHIAMSKKTFHQMRIYLPAIVTNANLYSAKFDPGDVSLDSGRLPAGKCEFTQVPLVRFRKGLRSPRARTPRVTIDPREKDLLHDINQAGQRTILIINSASFSNVLSGFRIPENRLQRTEQFLGSLLVQA
jgi:hypothetical protein